MQSVLLQKRYHSFAFTPLYDFAIDTLRSNEARSVAQEIVREEYPLNEQSHGEDLFEDLFKL